MQEKNGVAFCSSTYAAKGFPPRCVCAAPVFVPVTMSADDLPLGEIYDHPDFIDLISAREFGLEQTNHDRLLLCILAAATPQALGELMNSITPTGRLIPCASCQISGENMLLSQGETRCRLSVESWREQQLPLPAMLTALTCWCTGYDARLYWEAEP